MAKKALIVLDGRKPACRTLEGFWNNSELKVCADGAAATCLEYGLTPDLIIGDLDSLEASVSSQFQSTEIIKMADQDTTDGEKAIQYCLDKGYRNLLLFGAVGKRLDHSLYNIGLLRTYKELSDKIQIISDDEIAFLIFGNEQFTAPTGTRISLMPVFGKVDSVTVRGLEYSIENESLELGVHSSVSNSFSNPAVSINTSQYLLVVIERHPDLVI